MIGIPTSAMIPPLFYFPGKNSGTIQLDENTSKHIVGVLRMKIGEKIQITDGNGHRFTTEIIDDHKKRCIVKIISDDYVEMASAKLIIAISLLKNSNRFEWFLEKATEIGVRQIIPLVCDRTEKQTFRYERFQQIIVSAMLQSQQVYLPLLETPVAFAEYVIQSQTGNKYIAHCSVDEPRQSLFTIPKGAAATILLGPEGDFSGNEIQDAKQKGFLPVSLGTNRLRSETAGIVAAVLLKSF